MFTHKEWMERKKAAAARREGDRASYSRSLHQAEVGAAQLTQHAAWNWFLQILSAQKQAAEKALAAIDEKSRSSDDFSFEGLARTQASRISWASRIWTLGEVMGLPVEIVSDSKKAKERLEELNRAESQGNSTGAAAS